MFTNFVQQGREIVLIGIARIGSHTLNRSRCHVVSENKSLMGLTTIIARIAEPSLGRPCFKSGIMTRVFTHVLISPVFMAYIMGRWIATFVLIPSGYKVLGLD